MGESLAFDTHQRLEILTHFVQALLPADSAAAERPRVLDVGGYPALLAHALAATHDVVTVDRESGRVDGYVRASGDALPFRPGTFDAVVASDVLEHVPAEVRQGFLDEMVESTRGWLLLGGPFRSPAVDAAEESVADFARFATGQGNAWIEEHRRCGLPDLAETRGFLADRGLASVDAPNGSLFSWFTLQQIKTVLHATPDGFAAYDGINDLYVALSRGSDHALPVYRHLILAHRDGGKIDALLKSSQLGPSLSLYGPKETPPSDPPDAAEKIRGAAEAFRHLVTVVREGRGGEPEKRVERDYVTRLETLLDRQEARQAALANEIRDLRSRLSAFESSRFIRLWRRLRGQ
ncbi:class I SAM-dependent methyltransferase [Candidatus Sumerlaeota bacterium]|nr:class I SAM-dependent methyltransferase [Candidatus Sumerlaeota bacterium]